MGRGKQKDLKFPQEIMHIFLMIMIIESNCYGIQILLDTLERVIVYLKNVNIYKCQQFYPLELF